MRFSTEAFSQVALRWARVAIDSSSKWEKDARRGRLQRASVSWRGDLGLVLVHHAGLFIAKACGRTVSGGIVWPGPARRTPAASGYDLGGVISRTQLAPNWPAALGPLQ